MSVDPANPSSGSIDAKASADSVSSSNARAGVTADTEPGEQPAWRSPLAWCTLGIVFVGGLVIDIWSKYWAYQKRQVTYSTFSWTSSSSNPVEREIGMFLLEHPKCAGVVDFIEIRRRFPR
jgi:hypothetical protein